MVNNAGRNIRGELLVITVRCLAGVMSQIVFLKGSFESLELCQISLEVMTWMDY